MADNNNPSGNQLPPPQPNVGAPGFDPSQNGQGNPTHMPPPPLHIPPNTNPIPTAITSPDKGVMSPTSGGPFARRSAPEPNKRALYVGGLDPRVTEDVLRQIFETTGHVQNVKIIPDKNVRPLAPPNYLPSTIFHLLPSFPHPHHLHTTSASSCRKGLLSSHLARYTRNPLPTMDNSS